MSSLPNRLIDEDLNPYAITAASAAASCALGILFGRGMGRRSSNITSLALLASSALIAAPVVAGVISRIANRPASARGSRKRLESIRNGSYPVEGAEIYSLDDTF